METALENGHATVAGDVSALRSAADSEDESALAADFGLPGCPEGARSHVLNADAMPKPNAPVTPTQAGDVASAELDRLPVDVDHQQAAETDRPPSEAVQHLLDKILEFDEDDIVWIIRNLKTRFHPDLYEDADIQTTMSVEDVVQRLDSQEALAVAVHTQPMSPKFSAATPKWQAQAEKSKSKALDDQPIVQFSSFMYFCMEDESVMKVDVMRAGNLAERSEVQYRTQDATAMAGKKYVATSGTLVFEPEENQKEIQIPILQNDRWETTLEFVIELTKEGLKNATLGFYLYRARVKIIDDDAFPTNKYRKDVLSGDFSNIPGQSLLREYFKMVWMDRDARCCTINMVVVDQLHNINFLLQLFTNVYLVDYVLNQDKAEDHLVVSKNRDANLILIVALALLPFAFLHVIDYTRLVWELSAADLQRNLLRKFLNYDETSRAELREGNLIMAMNRDANKLVSGGYMQTIALAKAAGKLFMILVYQFASPFAFGRTEYFSEATFWVFSFCPLIVLPLLLMTFMSCRRKKNTHVLDARNHAQDELIKHVHQTSENYRLIADYHRRPSCVAHFQELIDKYDDDCLTADQVLKNNEYFQKWVTNMLVAITTLGLGHAVNSPTQYPLGMFLVNLAICTYIGDAWAEIYQVLLSMEQVLPALFRITWLMNLKTDVAHRMRLNRYRRTLTTQGREALRGKKKGAERRLSSNSEELPIDSLSISIQNIQFAYCSRGCEMKFNFVGSMDIKQGSLVALVGHRGEGKTTVLKILGGVILPAADDEAMSKGQVFYVPSHLRVLHVSSEPMFFHGTLYENLVFGVSSETHPDADIRRVKRICQLLTLPDNVTRFLDREDHLDWDEVFSQTQLALLTLARSLISNPEVLCIHKPTLFLDVKTSSSVLQMLRYFVEQKGLLQDPESWHLRRPRTCMITISRHEALKVVDCVYLVTKDSIHAIPWKSVTPQLLE